MRRVKNSIMKSWNYSTSTPFNHEKRRGRNGRRSISPYLKEEDGHFKTSSTSMLCDILSCP
jgi:hypothetical protein